ncbi:hypothetical protein ATO6_15100 [Oceanicola sp. 22II-s10i]|uniref:hypothetical protein n=1 Tax=Oceanicola sp. 22II-s10i TaxID=1317116 RepID=UPI000B528988|nr:hypothetical protein [Oceanicola sp. 22II-s10i]OWU84335.1 hypothetical protein ATO6_15100 [Oceanicola sp. 22II-s10i]
MRSIAIALAVVLATTSVADAGALFSVPPGTQALQQPTLIERLERLAEPSRNALLAACCKTCRKGKACGDSCISRDKTCRKGIGCACDG